MKESAQKRCINLKRDALHSGGNYMFHSCSRSWVPRTFEPTCCLTVLFHKYSFRYFAFRLFCVSRVYSFGIFQFDVCDFWDFTSSISLLFDPFSMFFLRDSDFRCFAIFPFTRTHAGTGVSTPCVEKNKNDMSWNSTWTKKLTHNLL